MDLVLRRQEDCWPLLLLLLFRRPVAGQLKLSSLKTLFSRWSAAEMFPLRSCSSDTQWVTPSNRSACSPAWSPCSTPLPSMRQGQRRFTVTLAWSPVDSSSTCSRWMTKVCEASALCCWTVETSACSQREETSPLWTDRKKIDMSRYCMSPVVHYSLHASFPDYNSVFLQLIFLPHLFAFCFYNQKRFKTDLRVYLHSWWWTWLTDQMKLLFSAELIHTVPYLVILTSR